MFSVRTARAIVLGAVLACATPAFSQGGDGTNGEWTEQEAANAATVRTFYEAALNRKDADAAASHLGDVYIQHNPAAQDGAAGLAGFVGWLGSNFPDNHSEIKRVLADGDFVVLHVHTKRTPDALGNAIMEIFRLDNGKIVEHWDVIQPVPEESANDNGMF